VFKFIRYGKKLRIFTCWDINHPVAMEL
jgi:hypothetical protein